ncbi:MFS transporter [bacterium]|nr:MFS transporter [bacterium]
MNRINNIERDIEVTSNFSKWQALAFGAPNISLAFFVGPMGVIQGIYAKYYGVALTTLATVLLIGRIFDAATDPLIGHYSDRYRSRKGTRKPFILLGGLSLIPCSYFLFVPQGEVTVVYFILWSLLFYLALTVINIPMYAWGSELYTDSVERTRLFTVWFFVGQIGSLLFFLIPFLPLFSTGEITPETLRISFVIGAVFAAIGLYCALRYVPNGPPPVVNDWVEKSTNQQPKTTVFKEMYNVVKSNKPFQIFVFAYLCIGFGTGMFFGLFFIFVDAFLDQGAIFATLSVIGIVGGLLLTPVVYKIVLLLGKRNTWLMASVVILSGVVYIGNLSPSEDLWVELVIVYVGMTLGGSVLGVIIIPMLSDTVDYGLLSDKTERRGTYFSIYTLMTKAQVALALSLGLALAGWLGFDATATTHDESSAFAIHLAISWVPAVILTLGLFFIWHYPLDEHRCAIIARRLQRRTHCVGELTPKPTT